MALAAEIVPFIRKQYPVIISAALFALLFLPLTPELIHEWSTNPYYSHGFLIPLLSAYFLWIRRREIAATPVSVSAAGVAIVAAGTVLFILARMSFQFFFQCVGLCIVLLGLVFAHLGPQIARAVAFPYAYLYFMIPMPQIAYETMTFHLRLFSTQVSFLIIRLFGIPATRDGNIINLQTATLIVGNPCSGLRGLISFVVGSLAIGFLFQKKLSNRVILVVFSVILAMAMNILRLVVLAVLAHAMRLEKIPVSVHDAEGMILLVIGLLILFGVSDFLAKRDEQTS